jgi:hypothetical protein
MPVRFPFGIRERYNSPALWGVEVNIESDISSSSGKFGNSVPAGNDVDVDIEESDRCVVDGNADGKPV